jgi:hypothetical protein
MRRIFWGFCRNWFLIDPLHYLSSRSDFVFEFAEIFIVEKQLPNLFRLWLQICADIRNRKTTPRLGESAPLRLGELAFECLQENSATRGVGYSPTRQLGDSVTWRFVDSEIRGLPDSGSSYGESGSHYSNVKKIFCTLNC